MQAIGFIHLPEINLSDENIAVGSGEIVRLPVEEWIKMDPYYMKFETQVRSNGEPIFYKFEFYCSEDEDEMRQTISEISKRLHLSLMLYSGIITIVPEISITYIIIPEVPEIYNVAKATLRLVGDSGREFFVNNYDKLVLRKSEEKDINKMHQYLLSCENILNSPIIDNITNTLISMGVVGMTSLSKIMYLVSSIENLFLSDIKKNIRQTFADRIYDITAPVLQSPDYLQPLLKAIYDIRSATVHGQNTDKILNKNKIDSEQLLYFTFQIYFIIFLKILDNSPEDSTEIQVKDCIANLSSTETSFPDLNFKWLHNG